MSELTLEKVALQVDEVLETHIEICQEEILSEDTLGKHYRRITYNNTSREFLEYLS